MEHLHGKENMVKEGQKSWLLTCLAGVLFKLRNWIEDPHGTGQKDLFLILTNQIADLTWDLNHWIPRLASRPPLMAMEVDAGGSWSFKSMSL